ncbi:response regulator transcription factor [Pseudobacteriovorax antillogorgiicola]|uniref:Two-component system, chemotaxis family, response regulator CheY n=1 Tax=Pseudobacteriovorax antillogorgiicola TaxID=1513793 RepID=A0A1Y6B540_9BACT|nr:response regulator [Pseudobacteriovorax antillogorgiicola]TCS59267.1 two-component system chemotaxis response regulator CheY [Pseudobacteriovorax antillogorgiicola]SME89909.1 two-component system, chemotaxis family, response regulator CheY [Pseudobacteriovorax antillogorgiicola]
MDQALNILVVDDSQILRQDLRNRFESLGHRVVGEAENGLEALDLIKELSPDLVSLDIIMPEMDGLECYRIMRSLSYPPRCLIVSALADEPRVIETYEKEIEPNHYASKTCSLDELAEKLSHVMAMPPLPIPESHE